MEKKYKINENEYSVEEIHTVLKGMILNFIALNGLNFIKISIDVPDIIVYLKKAEEMCRIVNLDYKKILIYLNEFEKEGVFLRYSNDILLLHKKPNILIQDSAITGSTIVLGTGGFASITSSLLKNTRCELGDDEYMDMFPVSLEIRDSVVIKSFSKEYEGDIKLSINPEINQEFLKNTIGQLKFTVVNTGKQIVNDIKLELIGPIDVIGNTTLKELKPKKTHIFMIGIKASEIGSIPILYKIYYMDKENNKNVFEGECWIKVRDINKEDIGSRILAKEVHIGDVKINHHSTSINGSVVQRSNIGGENENILNICPYCGQELKFLKTPNFCPYCKEQITT